MRRWALALFCIQTVASSCPSGFELVSNGQCRGVGQLGDPSVIVNEWEQEAVRVCKQKNANPIIIHNKEEQDYWTNVSTHSTNWYIPFGIECNTNSKKWQWADGSPIDYKPPSYYPALDKDCVSTLVFYMLKDDPGDWRAWSAIGKFTIDIYCVLNLAPPEQLPEGCFDADENGEQLCFAISNSSGNWNDARELCASYGAAVASIHSEQENSFLRRTAVSRGFLNGLLLGGTKSGKTDSFSWLDGSLWNYDKFVPDFPLNGGGDCLAMDTFDVKGEWVNVECTAEMPTACVKRGSSGCAGNGAKEGELVTSPGYPHDASVPCDMFLSVDTGKQVEVTINLEANSCCDHLVLYEGSLGGKIIANLTGSLNGVTYRTSSSNIMRASWQPNGGVNVKGALMNFRAV